MSSILDALEKAEEERIRDLSPGLRPARRASKARRRRLPAIAAGVALLLLLNLLFWWFYLRAVPEADPAEVPQVARAPEPEVVPPRVVPPVQPKPAIKPALSLHEQLKRNAAPSAKPLIEEAQVTRKPVPAAAAIPPAPAQPAEPVQEPTAAPAPPARRAEPVQAAVADTELARAGPPPGRVEREPPALPSAPTTPPLAPSDEASPSLSGNEPEPPLETPQQEQIPLVWELSQTLREKVLQLKSSVHVYSAVPAQRFVIINMRRYAEGDTLPPDGFRLARIDQDGVVIDYGAGLVRLPRR